MGTLLSLWAQETILIQPITNENNEILDRFSENIDVEHPVNQIELLSNNSKSIF